MSGARENADLPVAMTESGGKVGVGMTPVVNLDIAESSSGVDAILGLTAGTGGRAQIRSEAQGDGTSSEISFHTMVGSNTSERMRIDGSGRVTMPNQPVYSASDSRAVVGTNSHLNSSNFYNHVYVNVGNHMNTNNGNFTCPVAGVYRIYFRATHNNSGCNVRLQKNGSTINEAYSAAVGNTYSVSSEAVVSCAANDTLRIQFHEIHTSGGHQHKQVTFQLLH